MQTHQAIGGSKKRPSSKDGTTIRVGISTCLLGQKVRWDGGHKRDQFLTDVLGRYVEWVPVCPEFEVGMGIPREPVRLVKSGRETHMRGVASGRDWTAVMRRWVERRVRELAKLQLCGFVFKKGSPSCGMERVKVYDQTGKLRKEGSGVFAEALMRQRTMLPVEEEGRLNDPLLRESFIERVFAYRHLCSLFGTRWAVGSVVAFHTKHKLQLMAHSPQAYTRLGRLVAQVKRIPRTEFRAKYEAGFMAALSERATRHRHVNVMQHCLGYLREKLDEKARTAILGIIEDYRAGIIPLVVPLTIIRHYVQVLGIEYLAGQRYLEPHPKELMLRNHV
jgi:uncharacterized protein YbgA (DUF1722 family)/uncharacterized protein YbbK (DUF523 family)